MKDDLDDLRRGIDQVDAELRVLLARRMELALGVAQAKKKAAGVKGAPGPVYYRPGREAQMMRALADHAGSSPGAFPARAAIGIWRELISASIVAQALGLTVAVADRTCELLAQAHFGAMSKIDVHATALQVLSEVEQGRSMVGIVDGEGLVGISNTPSPVNVVGLLPFVRPSTAANRYILARQQPEPSGDDMHVYRLADDAEGKARLVTVASPDALSEATLASARYLGGYARPLELMP